MARKKTEAKKDAELAVKDYRGGEPCYTPTAVFVKPQVGYQIGYPGLGATLNSPSRTGMPITARFICKRSNLKFPGKFYGTLLWERG